MSLPDHGPLISTFRLRRRTPGTFVLVPCERLGRSIRCQGQLEAAAAQILVAAPAVKTLLEQPLRIDYAWREQPPAIRLLAAPPARCGQRTERCSFIVPDFLVELASGKKWLVEVKPSARLSDPLVARKLAVGRLFAESRGWNYRVLTEQQLFRGPVLRNVQLLARFGHWQGSSDLLATIEARVRESPATIARLLLEAANHQPASTLLAALFHLLATGRLDADLLAAPLTDQTLVYLGGTFSWDPFDSVWAPDGSSTDGPSR